MIRIISLKRSAAPAYADRHTTARVQSQDDNGHTDNGLCQSYQQGLTDI